MKRGAIILDIAVGHFSGCYIKLSKQHGDVHLNSCTNTKSYIYTFTLLNKNESCNNNIRNENNKKVTFTKDMKDKGNKSN